MFEFEFPTRPCWFLLFAWEKPPAPVGARLSKGLERWNRVTSKGIAKGDPGGMVPRGRILASADRFDGLCWNRSRRREVIAVQQISPGGDGAGADHRHRPVSPSSFRR